MSGARSQEILLTRELVALLTGRLTSGVPSAVLDVARVHIADTIGIAVGAIATRLCRQVSRGLRTPYAASFPDGALSTDPAPAAFYWSACAHALDFDDIHDEARVHPTAVTLPAALVAGEVSDAGTSVAEAVALGNELMIRLGLLAADRGTGPSWFLSQLFGYFGAALAFGMRRGLDEKTLVSALGLAYMQCAGGKEAAFSIGSTARAVYPAFAALGGVQAARLAEAGIVGPVEPLTARTGVFSNYLQFEIDHELARQLLEPVGWPSMATAIKPYPSCRSSHAYVGAAFEARRELGGSAVEKIHVRVAPIEVSLCEPLAGRCRPTTLQDAKYSIPFMVSVALVHGHVDLALMGDSIVHDPEVLGLAERVTVSVLDPSEPATSRTLKVLSRGHWSSFPCDVARLIMDVQAVEEKFAACLRYAGVEQQASEDAWTRVMSDDPGGALRVVLPAAV